LQTVILAARCWIYIATFGVWTLVASVDPDEADEHLTAEHAIALHCFSKRATTLSPESNECDGSGRRILLKCEECGSYDYYCIE
jgi:hypothetical protein